MTTLAIHSDVRPLVRPEPRGGPIIIRPAVFEGADLHFIDELMKQHAHMVGFASTTELRSYIEEGTALIAADAQTRLRIGYLLYRDRYMKREDCGVVSQLNVLAGKQRGLVGAALVQAMFARLPYGVRLFCCWCAQDLEANRFWEALGFVPLAYRAGSRGKQHGGTGGRKDTRMHIYWQRRVRRGADGELDDYPYWFPSQTKGGRLGEPRIVLPLQPGKHWSDELSLVLPGGEQEQRSEVGGQRSVKGALQEGETPKPKRARKTKAPPPPPAPQRPKRGLWFAGAAAAAAAAPPVGAGAGAEPVDDKPRPKPKRERHRNDPKLVAAAREFRDRYLDEVNSGAGRHALEAWGAGKYDVSRQLAAGPTAAAPAIVAPHLLNAA